MMLRPLLLASAENVDDVDLFKSLMSPSQSLIRIQRACPTTITVTISSQTSPPWYLFRHQNSPRVIQYSRDI